MIEFKGFIVVGSSIKRKFGKQQRIYLILLVFSVFIYSFQVTWKTNFGLELFCQAFALLAAVNSVFLIACWCEELNIDFTDYFWIFSMCLGPCPQVEMPMLLVDIALASL